MCVIQHIYIIAILFNFISDVANKVIAAIQPLLTRLTNEIQSLRKELHASKKEKKTVIMPAQPFKEIEPFLEFEKGLQEIAENFNSFVSSILSYTQKNASVKKM